jgi:two-component system LytT family sensor kinase
LIALSLLAVIGVPMAALLVNRRARRAFATSAEQATFEVLHLANEAAPPFRDGLTAAAAGRSVRQLRRLLGVEALALTDSSTLLAWDGAGEHHAALAVTLARPVLGSGRAHLAGADELACAVPTCPVRAGIVVPIQVGGATVGTLQAFGSRVGPGTIRAATEVARWVATQVELAHLDQSQARAAAAEVRALRAQISPHFVYNALTAIASFVRTDPERARELVLQFADFTRYSFRSHGEFTTLAEELRAVDAYLMIERARFGDRLSVRVQVAPEVLAVVIPFLVVQPLVENAVRHGIEGRAGPGRIEIVAEDRGVECFISVEDDGVGIDPESLRRLLAGESEHRGVGVANVDERLRTVYGAEHGLVFETAPGAGTKVTVRVPKYKPGVRVA